MNYLTYAAFSLFALAALPTVSIFNLAGSAWAQNASAHSITISHRKVQGKNTLQVTQGDQVELKWQTDEIVKLHLHGYDIEQTVTPGKTRTMKFKAKATGRFPVTSHGFGGGKGHSHGSGALFYIEVHPK
ncbi:MAG: hypothetical protein HN731_14850 [Rhodospirillaceae bacterium]|nr:hypothetical protein [Rhodospirillaceae bacterium]MBT7956468.1 hypothetical protein [Rhodospirillaceae bacterium]